MSIIFSPYHKTQTNTHFAWVSLPLRVGGTDLVVQKVCVSEKGPSPASLMACILKL